MLKETYLLISGSDPFPHKYYKFQNNEYEWAANQ